MIVRLLPLCGWQGQERQRLLQLPLPQALQRPGQLRDRLVLRLVPQPCPPPPRHLQGLLSAPRPVGALAELPERPQPRQVLEHPPQVRPLLLAQALRTLDDQVPAFEEERRLLLGSRPLTRPPPPPPRPLPRPARLAPAAGVAPPGHPPPQPAHGVEYLLVHPLQHVEDAQLVPRPGPHLGQGRRVEVGAVGDDRLGE